MSDEEQNFWINVFYKSFECTADSSVAARQANSALAELRKAREPK